MDKCNFKQGSLPECAPLALAQTPMQCASEPAYDKRMALARGTLFPGLDLPSTSPPISARRCVS